MDDLAHDRPHDDERAHDDGDRVVPHPAADGCGVQTLARCVQAGALLLDARLLRTGVRRTASGHGSSRDVEERAYRARCGVEHSRSRASRSVGRRG
jgi:hypothetical protein